MIVADTSAWVALLRGSPRPVRRTLRRLIDDEGDLWMSEVVLMELLAGARTDADAVDLRRRLVAFPLLRLEGLDDFERAAAIYRECRRGGETVRDLDDCLVAAVALRANAEVLHNDRDFDTIARHTGLRIFPVAA